MADPDRDSMLLEEFFPEGPVENLESIYVEIVPDPLRVMLEFRGPSEALLYRVFVGPATFFRFLEMQFEVGQDLRQMFSAEK